MPKTKDAFALRDFDATKILQRRYFKQFNLPNKTDEEILKILTADDDVESMEKNLSTLKALAKRCETFNFKIRRHIARRIKLFDGAEKYLDYPTADWAVNDLMKKLSLGYYELETKIEKQYRERITERLRYYRLKAGLTQKELAELVQVSPMGMSHYARGERDLPTHTLIRISKVLNVTADKLLGLQ